MKLVTVRKISRAHLEQAGKRFKRMPIGTKVRIAHSGLNGSKWYTRFVRVRGGWKFTRVDGCEPTAWARGWDPAYGWFPSFGGELVGEVPSAGNGVIEVYR
jgi:hypothetical protein